jgi:hypothetical protein
MMDLVGYSKSQKSSRSTEMSKDEFQELNLMERDGGEL